MANGVTSYDITEASKDLVCLCQFHHPLNQESDVGHTTNNRGRL